MTVWLCKVLGHKYFKVKGGYCHECIHCWRCGMKKGES